MAKTPKGGMGVPPVNHAQDARAIAKLSHRFKKYLLEPALPAVLDSIWLWLLLYDPKRLADVARHRMAAQLHTLKELPIRSRQG